MIAPQLDAQTLEFLVTVEVYHDAAFARIVVPDLHTRAQCHTQFLFERGRLLAVNARWARRPPVRAVRGSASSA